MAFGDIAAVRLDDAALCCPSHELVAVAFGNVIEPTTQPEIRVLAVASAGGHWEQLMLLRPAFEGLTVVFATTDQELARREGLLADILPDTNRDHPLRTITCFWRAVRLIMRLRPDFVITTGAAPGLICVVAARVIGVRSIWIDSVANSERLSGSGWIARRLATLAVTQWEHLAAPPKLIFGGRLL